MATERDNGTALTPKQERFVQEYLIDCNATQAATRAGYAPATARSQGQRLLTNADIRAAVHEGQRARRERLEITADKVLMDLETARQAAFEAGHYGTAVQASMGQAKIAGLILDRNETTMRPGGLEELQREIEANRRRLAELRAQEGAGNGAR